MCFICLLEFSAGGQNICSTHLGVGCQLGLYHTTECFSLQTSFWRYYLMQLQTQWFFTQTIYSLSPLVSLGATTIAEESTDSAVTAAGFRTEWYSTHHGTICSCPSASYKYLLILAGINTEANANQGLGERHDISSLNIGVNSCYVQMYMKEDKLKVISYLHKKTGDRSQPSAFPQLAKLEIACSELNHEIQKRRSYSVQ